MSEGATPQPPSEPGSDPAKPKGAGMIPRRVEMPIGMWNEVLGVARDGGIDHRDAMIALIDLGLQAQDEGQIKPRLVSVDSSVWNRVGQAKLSGVSDQEALTYLVDLGLQARHAQLAASPVGADEGIPPPGTLVRVDLMGGFKLKRILEAYLLEVPTKGEVITIGSDHYEIEQRAWVLSRSRQTAYLRVIKYKGGA